MPMWKYMLAFLAAYLLGSMPTALLYSRLTHGVDIRSLGDGNMGSRNTKRQFGWSAGVLVALVDILKGAAAVMTAFWLNLPEMGQYVCGAAAVLGHDFSLFAKFKGGQGLATTTGVFLALFPEITLIGFVIYVILYFSTRISDLAAGLGMAFIAGAVWLDSKSLLAIGFIVVLLLFIPMKKYMDRGRSKDPFGKGSFRPA